MCEACDAPVVTGSDNKLTWQAVPYAICYVVTKNNEVVGFTTETSYDGYTAADKWEVQAVNEFGGLSQKATANATPTAIETVAGNHAARPEAIYAIDGKRIARMQHGLNIVRMSDGTVRKVLVK
jgi:hypothetical protein